MDDGLVWRMTFTEAPHRVFCALVRVTSQHGRLHGVHDFGRAVRFTPGHDLAGPVLEARLTANGTGTLLEVVPVGWCRVQVPAEAESIGSLVHQLRQHFGSTPPSLALAS